MSSMTFALHSFDQGDHISSWFQPYRQEDWWDKPTKIVIEFEGRLDSDMPFIRFRYELHIAHRVQDFSNKAVLYEALLYAPKGKYRRLFEREGQNFYFGNEFGISSSSEKKNSIRTNASVLSTLAKLNHHQSIYLNQFIGMWQTNIIGFGRVQQKNMQWLSVYAQDKVCLERLNRELRRLDIGLESMSIEAGPKGYFAKLNHIGLGDSVFLHEESAGTRRFIEIFPHLHYALESGGIAVIDELDTDFHPLLIPELFNWFSDLNRNACGAQLLFTANNPTVLDELEKEQIFLVEKSSGQSTHVYCARDIKGLRRDLSLMKKYLSGELGAVPHMG
ncbi:MAG: ATP-binding protein [Gammaproteobacteria bacterium]|nr:ATP-binding protein [Gammaproteobacteria bacterium]